MKRVLVVDDEDENLYLLQALLGSNGYEVDKAHDGAEALEKARQAPPDLIVSDILMPVMDGFALCRAWKADDRLSTVPFIFYTATYTDPEDERLALEIGADAFLIKPAEPEDLMAKIVAVLDRPRVGRPGVTPGPSSEDTGILEHYSKALVRKLEDKMRQLEKANQALEEANAECRRVDAALVEQNRFVSTLVDTAPALVYVYDMETASNVYSNHGIEQILGYTAEEIREMGADLFARLIHPDDLAEVVAFQSKVAAAADGEILAIEYRMKDVDGQSVVFYSQESPFLRNADGSLRQKVGVAIDITERKRAEASLRESEEQLRQSQKMEAVGQLAGGIAHDFNNLLTAILGYSELLLSSEQVADAEQQDVQEIKRSAERAGALTKQILAFSRRQALRPDVVSLNEVLAGMESLLSRTLGEHIDLVSLQHPDLGHAEIDVHQFEQVLMNLALNARDAMPSGGRLTLETANVELGEEYCRAYPEVTPGSYVMLAVSDTGAGMDEATLEHAFEPFFTTKAPGEGTGLGLATVYGIVKQSRGNILVYSEPGKGTSFKIYLPRVTAREAAEAVALPEHAPSLGNETVMVVEDEPSVRSLIERVLGGVGYEVVCFGSADEAVAALEQGRVAADLLLTDVVLPGALQGKDLVDKVQSLRPDLPVLYMSGYTHDAVIHAGRLDEGVDFLDKPFTPETLARAVRGMLDRARSLG